MGFGDSKLGPISIEYGCTEWHRRWSPAQLPQHKPAEIIGILGLSESLLDLSYESTIPYTYFENLAHQSLVNLSLTLSLLFSRPDIMFLSRPNLSRS